MEFFNRKQEVIDIQLTPRGRHLLSKGKWRPKFYAFYDRDVIYDVGYAAHEENQKDSSDRIKSSVRTKAIPITYGIEAYFMEAFEGYDPSPQQGTWTPPADLTFPRVVKTPSVLRNLKNMRMPLGNSNLNSSYYPSFAMNFYDGHISSSFNFYTGSAGGAGQEEPIPQINCSVDFIVDVKSGGVTVQNNEIEPSTEFKSEISEPGLEISPEDDRVYSQETYADGTYVSINTRQLLLDIIEKHIPLDREDFDLEVFEVLIATRNDGGTSYEKEVLREMFFIRDDLGDDMVNYGDVIYNKQTRRTFPINARNVEYFFDVRVDNEIEPYPDAPANIIEQPPNPEEPCADE